MTLIAPYITAFFQKSLGTEQASSPQTCDTYAYAFQLLFEFMSRKLGVLPADLQLEQLDAPIVVEFLDYLQKIRHNSACSRNARLAAIRSFMRFIEFRVPSALEQVRRVPFRSKKPTDVLSATSPATSITPFSMRRTQPYEAAFATVPC